MSRIMTKLDVSAVERLAADSGTPEWVREILLGSPAEVAVEEHTIDESYLEFLSEQIQLEPRGPDWAKVLSARLDAFKTVVGQPLMRIAVIRGNVVFVGNVRISDLKVIHTEEL